MRKRRFSTLIRVAIGFIAMFGLLLFERMGIMYGNAEVDISILPYDQVMQVKELKREKTCLLLYESGNATSLQAVEMYDQILTDMRVPFEKVDLTSEGIEGLGGKLKKYRTLIIAMSDLSSFGEEILEIPRWVGTGGRALFGIPPYKSDIFNLISGKLGVINADYNYGVVDTFVSDENYMLGAFKTYPIMDAYESALKVELEGDCRIYASTEGGAIPLVWSREFKDGRFVICNFGYVGKAYRGIFSSAYTLLEDICVYPVINGSTFYLDDFPSPVPSGNGEYITRDFGVGVADFYSSVWWPDVLQLGEKHNIKYTGLVIETYDDKTYGELVSNDSTADYYYYGNMLLNQGGEIGYHGYNHQPLCGPDYVYTEDLGYNTWESIDTMYKGFEELTRFTASIFPSAASAVYVPPSDVLSPEGRAMLGGSFPNVRCIASIYLSGDDAYEQEFTVADDGMIETPRTVSGGTMDDYMKITAMSEMNFHFVASHFMHPDDLLDEDRGAKEGWKPYRQCLDDYMTWVDEAAVNSIRHVTGSGMAGAVQRYVNLIPDTTYDYNSMTINTKGLIDSAYYMIRVNDGVLGNVYGGELVKLNETLYLLKVQSPKVVVVRRE